LTLLVLFVVEKQAQHARRVGCRTLAPRVDRSSTSETFEGGVYLTDSRGSHALSSRRRGRVAGFA
jgi:hypothetical protein